MVCVILQGGLGNQLFIYAFARALAARLDTRVSLDLTVAYARERFGRVPIVPQKLSARHISYITSRSPGRKPLRALTWLGRRRLLPRALYRLERTKRFDPDNLRAPATPLLVCDGYFQAPQYFESIADRLKDDLVASRPAGLGYAGDARTVGVHVRRKDIAVKLPRAYYEAAFAAIERAIARPRYVIFTDAMDEALDFLPYRPERTLATMELQDEWQELHALASCSRIITSNSTFSWWAGWMRGGNDCVMAPASGFFDEGRGDILPEGWRVVEI